MDPRPRSRVHQRLPIGLRILAIVRGICTGSRFMMGGVKHLSKPMVYFPFAHRPSLDSK